MATLEEISEKVTALLKELGAHTAVVGLAQPVEDDKEKMSSMTFGVGDRDHIDLLSAAVYKRFGVATVMRAMTIQELVSKKEP